MRLLRSGCWGAIGALALACRVDETPAPTPPPPPAAARSETPAADPAADPPAKRPEAVSPSPPSATPSSSTPDPSAPPSPSLDDLLRLPGTGPVGDPVDPRLARDSDPLLPGAAPSRPSRLGVQIDSRSDPAAVHPAKTRSQTDAAVSVDVTESTRLRGGVRVQQQSDTEPAERVPTIGIEKRF